MQYYQKIAAILACLGCFAAPAVELLTPEDDGQYQNSRGVMLTWRTVEDAYAYEIQAGTASDELHPVFICASGDNYRFTGELVKNQTYYWQVVAHRLDGMSTTSAVFSFTTGDPELWRRRFVPAADPDLHDTEDDSTFVHESATLDLSRAVLLVIDYWGWGAPREIMDNVLSSIELARRHNIPVIFLPHDYPMPDEIQPLPWELVAGHEPLDDLLAQNGIDTLLYAGFHTSECILLSRTSSIMPMSARGDYEIILLRDCTAAPYWYYMWALNGVETMFQSATLDDLSGALGDDIVAMPYEWVAENPLAYELDVNFGLDMVAESTALVVINAWADHANDGWRARIALNNSENIKPMLDFARAGGLNIVHIANGGDFDPLCMPMQGEFVVANHNDLWDCLMSNNSINIIFMGNLINGVPAFNPIDAWRFTIRGGASGAGGFHTRLLADCITLFESPDSLHDEIFKTVFLERATCYVPDLYKVSSRDVLRGNLLAPVTNITVSMFTDRVDLTWPGRLGVSRYEIWRAAENDPLNAKLLAQTGTLNYSDFAAPVDTQSFYWVRAKSAFGVSGFSDAATGWRLLTSPGGLSASQGAHSDSVKLNWLPVDGALEYSVERALNAEFDDPVILVGGTVVETGWVDTAAQAGVVYYYRVAAGNDLGHSDYCVPVQGWRRSTAALNNMVNDYDGDGIADFVYLDGQGVMQVVLSGGGFKETTGYVDNAQPATTSSAVSGDYDGDGVSDPAWYSEAYGRWSIMLSGAGYSNVFFNFGGVGWQPASGDYDGDGRTDPTLYHRQSGQWMCLRSGSEYVVEKFGFGGATWTPTPGDYDGDGRTDPAIYSAEYALWRALLSSQDYAPAQIPMGGNGCVTVPGDYDGDGRTDLGVYHENTGTWQLRLSDAGYQSVCFTLGGPGWRPACADYDGDRRMDPMVYHATTGRWMWALSATGYIATVNLLK